MVLLRNYSKSSIKKPCRCLLRIDHPIGITACKYGLKTGIWGIWRGLYVLFKRSSLVLINRYNIYNFQYIKLFIKYQWKFNKKYKIYMKKTLSSCQRQRKQIEIRILILLNRKAQYHRDINSTKLSYKFNPILI